MSNLHCADCTFAKKKNQIGPTSPLEEMDMAGSYELGYEPYQEDTGE